MRDAQLRNNNCTELAELLEIILIADHADQGVTALPEHDRPEQSLHILFNIHFELPTTRANIKRRVPYGNLKITYVVYVYFLYSVKDY